MTTLTYIAATSACMVLIVAVGLLAAHVETARREREMPPEAVAEREGGVMSERFYVTAVKDIRGKVSYMTARAVGKDRFGKIYREPSLPPRETYAEAQRDLDRWAALNGAWEIEQ